MNDFNDFNNFNDAMNIFRPQQPYVFHPPKYQPWLPPVLASVSEALMRLKFKVRTVRVEGMEKVAELVNAGQSLLIAPNHADHPDPHVLVYAGRKRGLDSKTGVTPLTEYLSDRIQGMLAEMSEPGSSR